MENPWFRMLFSSKIREVVRSQAPAYGGPVGRTRERPRMIRAESSFVVPHLEGAKGPKASETKGAMQ